MLPQELEQQSQHSPGPVASGERLLRAIFSPDHIDTTTLLLRPEGIDRQDLMTRGFSVQRHHYVTRTKLRDIVDGYLRKSRGRTFEGFGLLVCEAVRQINDAENQQAFVVLDDGKPDDSAHAIIKFSKQYKPSAQRQLRKALCDRITALLSVDEAANQPPS